MIPKAVAATTPTFRLRLFIMFTLISYIQVSDESRKRLIPGTGIVASMPVLEQDHLPDFIDRQVLFPWRHDRGPRESFVRQSDPALGHAPENERFLQLGNRSRIGEVRRNRVECEGVQAATVQVVAVAEVTVLEENLATLSNILQITLVLVVPGIGIRLH